MKKYTLTLLVALLILTGCGKHTDPKLSVKEDDNGNISITLNEKEIAEVSVDEVIEEVTSVIKTVGTAIHGKTESVPETTLVPVQNEVISTDTADNNSVIQNTEVKEETLPSAVDRLNKAKEDLAKAKAKFDDAVKAHEKALLNKTESEANLRNLSLDVIKATENVKTAQSKYDEANTAYVNTLSLMSETDTYRQLVELASEQSKTVDLCSKVADQAKSDMEDSKKIYEEALVRVNESKDRLANLNNQYKEVQKDVEEAKSSYEEALNQSAIKKLLTKDYEEKLEEAKAKLDSANESAEKALLAYNKAKEESKNADKNVDVLYQNYLDKTKAYEAAEAVVAMGSLGFFIDHATNEDMYDEDTTIAERILEVSRNVAGDSFLTVIGEDGDATQLENMWMALDLIQKGNELRENDDIFTGRKALKVSDGLMMLAEIEANQEEPMFNHWVDNLNAQSREGRGVGENAAWYYKNPYDGWYDEEKTHYINKDGGQTGHYTNIMNSNYTVTGLGVTAVTYGGFSLYPVTSVQDFGMEYNQESFGKAYDFDEYYSAFMSYYKRVTEEVAKTKAEMENAKKAYENCDAEEYDENAYPEVLEAKAKYEEALSLAQSVKETYDVLVTESNNAETESNSADALLETMKAEFDQVITEEESLKEDIVLEEETLETVTEESESLKEDYEEDVTVYEESLEEYNTAVTELERINKEAEEELIRANSEVQEIITEAKENLDEAKKQLDDAKETLSEVTEEYEIAVELDNKALEEVLETEDVLKETETDMELAEEELEAIKAERDLNKQ